MENSNVNADSKRGESFVRNKLLPSHFTVRIAHPSHKNNTKNVASRPNVATTTKNTQKHVDAEEPAHGYLITAQQKYLRT